MHFSVPLFALILVTSALPQPPFSTPADSPSFLSYYHSTLAKDINTTYYCPRALRTLGPIKIPTTWTDLPEPCLLCCDRALRQSTCIAKSLRSMSGSTFWQFIDGLRGSQGGQGSGDGDGNTGRGVREAAIRGCVDGSGEVCGKCRFCLPVVVQRTVEEDGYCEPF